MRRAVVVIAVVVLLAGWGVASAQQTRTDAERIAELEARVARLEGVALPEPAAASEVWNGSFFVFDSDHTFYLYCEINQVGVTLSRQHELKCMGIKPEE